MTKTMKIFYCTRCVVATLRITGPVVCQKCNENMKEIGWMENE